MNRGVGVYATLISARDDVRQAIQYLHSPMLNIDELAVDTHLKKALNTLELQLEWMTFYSGSSSSESSPEDVFVDGPVALTAQKGTGKKGVGGTKGGTKGVGGPVALPPIVERHLSRVRMHQLQLVKGTGKKGVGGTKGGAKDEGWGKGTGAASSSRPSTTRDAPYRRRTL